MTLINLTYTQNIILHTSSLLLAIIILLFAQLTKVALLFALLLIFFNLRNIVKTVINREQPQKNLSYRYSPIKKLQSSQRSKFDVGEFEAKVKEAFQKNANKKCAYFEEDNKYWNNRYFCKSDQLEQLKDVRMHDLRKERLFKSEEDAGLKLQFSTIKKIRNYLQTHEAQDKATVSKIKQWCEGKFKDYGDPFAQISLTDRQIELCISLLQQYITSKISNDYDQIVNDFNAVDKFLQKCFSVSLSIQPSSSPSNMSFAELLQMVDMIQRKSALPYKLKANLSPHQIKKELLQVRSKISRLPDFSQPSNVLRLALFLKYLRRQFQNQTLICSGLDEQIKLRQSGHNHLFKFQDNQRLFYNKVTSIKSRCAGVPILLFVVSIWKQYYKSSKGIIKQVKSMLCM